MYHIKFPKIHQFRNVVSDVKNKASYNGRDEEGNPIYLPTVIMPKLTFTGTVKLHGTNSSVCYKPSTKEYWVQSKNKIITIGKKNDNYDFAKFAYEKEQQFKDMFNILPIPPDATCAIYGEWAGKEIQRNVGISQLPRRFYIFGVKIIPHLENDDASSENNNNSYWISSNKLKNNEHEIYNIYDFKTYEIEIDFNSPELAQNKLAELTQEVEKECPVSKFFGISGIGEGIVWTSLYKDNVYMFKVKGDEHSVTKVKTLASCDTEKIKSVNEFVDYSTTKNRFEQGLNEVFSNCSDELDIKKLGNLMEWMKKDIYEEEKDTLEKNNLTMKDVNKGISTKVRQMFFEKLSL